MKTLTRIQGITHNILGVMSIKDSCLLTWISVLQLILIKKLKYHLLDRRDNHTSTLHELHGRKMFIVDKTSNEVKPPPVIVRSKSHVDRPIIREQVQLPSNNAELQGL